VAWERRRPDPMLDVRIFANPRFTAASVAIAAAFFSLFGFIFLITQYFQVVRDYSALSAGVHTLPFAVGAAVTAPLAAALAPRLGSRAVVVTGLATMALGFAWSSTLDADSPYWGPVAGSMLLIAAGLSFTSAPATEVIMGSLPRHKAGVGSAVNDTTRELGGTFGVAVVGSIFSSVYGPRLVDMLEGLPIPPAAMAAAEESVVAASEVARQAPPAARETILDAARSAFLDGMAAGTRVAAVAALVGIALAIVALPGRESASTVTDEPPTGTEPVAAGTATPAGIDAGKAA
jgi:hypothetical protein